MSLIILNNAQRMSCNYRRDLDIEKLKLKRWNLFHRKLTNVSEEAPIQLANFITTNIFEQ